MTGILMPEFIIYNTLNSIITYIRNDLKKYSASPSSTFLYKLLGLDEDGNILKVNRYNFFDQAKKIFSDLGNLDISFGYSFKVNQPISICIVLPSEQPLEPTIGEDEGYQTEEIENVGQQKKFTQLFDTTYQIIITSSNISEVNLVYNVLKSLLIVVMPHLSLKGLMNIKLSGNDIVFNDQLIPAGMFNKVLNLNFQYELTVPQLAVSGFLKSFAFRGGTIE